MDVADGVLRVLGECRRRRCQPGGHIRVARKVSAGGVERREALEAAPPGGIRVSVRARAPETPVGSLLKQSAPSP